ncbi:MAG: DUF2461 domain-containing protein [Flavobacteriia bacterium]|nr:DUF2461 domain-containing protein [Flavobacteriia bacterium]
MAFFNSDYLLFFQELAQNNHKEWFDLNRPRYEKNVKVPFRDFTQVAIDTIAKSDPLFKDLLAKDCVFRINRDIRFSKDKIPYKTMCSAMISPNGKKSKAINGIYFEFTPEHVRFYGGIYSIEKEDLYAVRAGIVANLKEFTALLEDAEFKKVYGQIRGEKNKIIPSEFREAANDQALIYNKQWYFFVEYPAEEILSDDVLKKLIHAYNVAIPINQFLNQFI